MSRNKSAKFSLPPKMSRQRASLISSAKFARGAAPSAPETPYLSKGSKSAVEHVGGRSDEYVYTSDDGSKISYKRSLLRESLRKLKPHASTLIDRLALDVKQVYGQVFEQSGFLHQTPLFELFIEDVKQAFASPTVLPGTVAAYLAGCLVAAPENSLGGCDPRCLSAIPLPGADGSNICARSVIVLQDGTFTYLQNKGSESAVLLIYDKDFGVFTPEHRQFLQQHGIMSLDIIRLQADGTFSQVQENVHVIAPKSAEPATSGWSWIFWLVFALLIIIALVLLVLIVIRQNRAYMLEETPAVSTSWHN